MHYQALEIRFSVCGCNYAVSLYHQTVIGNAACEWYRVRVLHRPNFLKVDLRFLLRNIYETKYNFAKKKYTLWKRCIITS